ncbi:MAG: UDP-N-acetylmuramoyl-tripeptide--D-alanyl-D-alanine ligase [Cyanobacteria bacterium]|nr:UDP-N-acetylmuramoyl-tripeptide--D-alanyl-D-alanine ligase [Cyanobacteriota bacterium]
MSLPVSQLDALWGPPLARVEATTAIDRVSTDSRGDLAGALFVPLVGERFDGHSFLLAALETAGAVVAQRGRISDAMVARAGELGKPLWAVADTQLAYQQLGRLWRRHLAVPVVAVTGSAGKTTTRELIRALLAPLGPVVASSGNENNDVGVPLTLLKGDTTTAAYVVEMGMRGLGEIERLSRCAEPDVAVITNIGTAHIGPLVPLPLEGRHNARNFLLAVAVAQELGVPVAEPGAAPWAVDVPGGRSRRLQVAGIEVLDETYNASPEAMLAALELLAHQPLAAGARRYAVLGTMLELGEHSLALHRQVAERARQLQLDGLVIVDGGAEGEAMQAAAEGLPRLARVAEPEAAAAPLGAWLCPGDVVLLKASRGVALERLLPLLSCSSGTP